MKTNRLELSISPDYVPDWGVWEAVREIIQNALDAEDDTSKMRIKYAPKAGILMVMSPGVKIGRETLVLGKTAKDGRSTVGKYGEGYKLACAVLTRLKKAVEIVNGNEIWIPSIGRSASFGADVLCFAIEPGPKKGQDFVVTIGKITTREWKQIREKVLRLGRPDYLRYSTDLGEVLTGPGHERKVFIGGLYVCTLPDSPGARSGWLHGFNFRPGVVEIDRDRRLVAEWQVESYGSAMFKQVDDADAVADLVEANRRDVADLFAYGLDTPESVKAATRVFERFLAKNGRTAIPVANQDEARAAEYEYAGAKIVIVPTVVMQACRKAEGWDAYLNNFSRRTIREPAEFLERWLEDHRDQLSPVVARAFRDEVIGQASLWSLR